MSNVLIANCTVTVNNSGDGAALATGVVANMQPQAEPNLAEVLAAGGDRGLDYRKGYAITIDAPATLPTVNDLVNVTAFPGNVQLLGIWTIWAEPIQDTMFSTLVLSVARNLTGT